MIQISSEILFYSKIIWNNAIFCFIGGFGKENDRDGSLLYAEYKQWKSIQIETKYWIWIFRLKVRFLEGKRGWGHWTKVEWVKSTGRWKMWCGKMLFMKLLMIINSIVKHGG